MNELDDRLREHYKAVQLDQRTLDAIRSSSATPSRFRWPVTALSVWGVGGAVAALLLLSLSVGIHEFGSRTERTERTLSEAAMNHSTRLQFEFEPETLAEVDANMTQLPFEVALPAEFDDNYQLLGARYCTINGELAAHVKFLDSSSDKQVSLFMTRSVDDLQKIRNTKDSVDGVNVTLWNESGLFYAMASR